MSVCACGCGQPVTKGHKWVNAGHARRINAHHVDLSQYNTGGLCRCGCGGKTTIAKYTQLSEGMVRGVPMMFIHGHQSIGVKLPNRYVVDEKTGCWLWQLATNDEGYGTEAGEFCTAHKNAYVRAKGPVPPGYDLHHTCEVRHCVNPDHIVPITPQEHGRITNGKLSFEIADEIRRLRTTGKTYKALADMFGVTESGISHILNGRSWVRDIDAA